MKKLLALSVFLLTAAAPDPGPISPDRLSAHVRTLASDEYEGRAPGTPGERKTIGYLVRELKAAGLRPGGPDGAWTQPVPLIRTQLGPVDARVGAVRLEQGRDVALQSVRPDPRVSLKDLPIVFVGYGVHAPERGWDDFKGADVRGKLVVFLVNDPDFEASRADDSYGKFGGRRMTYYGRWTYKYEEAARQGAAAALIVHDTPGAGYPWSTAGASQGESYDVVRPEPNDRIRLQGWLEGSAAQRLFAAAGLDLARLRAAARRSDFRPVELKGQRFSADIPVSVTRATSYNVLAKLPGRTRPDEVVMFGAHWDAYGKGAPDGNGRTIRPGANDDALGVAGLIELGRAFARGPRPERSLLFGFWTGEERGLLGSETYAANPLVPANRTVANLTLDILNTGGPSRDVLLVGEGQNALEDYLTDAARAQGRVVTPEALPERGLFYRADHFPLARKGVPTLLLMAISGAPDLVSGGREAGQRWLDGYMACYHKTCDAWTSELDFRGAAEDVALVETVARRLANGTEWPEWREGSEFKAVRDASRR